MPPQVRAGEPGAAARVESGGEGAAWPTAREGVDRSASHRRHGVLELGELAVERVRKVVEERLDEARRRLRRGALSRAAGAALAHHRSEHVLRLRVAWVDRGRGAHRVLRRRRAELRRRHPSLRRAEEQVLRLRRESAARLGREVGEQRPVPVVQLGEVRALAAALAAAGLLRRLEHQDRPLVRVQRAERLAAQLLERRGEVGPRVPPLGLRLCRHAVHRSRLLHRLLRLPVVQQQSEVVGSVRVLRLRRQRDTVELLRPLLVASEVDKNAGEVDDAWHKVRVRRCGRQAARLELQARLVGGDSPRQLSPLVVAVASSEERGRRIARASGAGEEEQHEKEELGHGWIVA
mmetsp:Transcript_20394/g.60226  ORF Transcript_20394/g.60226 Transcript_20394/m.60226 type:complete len:349 (+) Transcript_20394:657-1703(+)